MTHRKLWMGCMGLALGMSVAGITLGADSTDISNSARKKGLKEAPELIKSTGVICTLADARLVESGSRASSFAGSTLNSSSGGGGGGGGSPPPSGGGGGGGGGSPPPGGGGGGGGGSPSTQYELACSEGLGYLVTVRNKTPEAVPCLELEDQDNPPSSGPPGGAPTGAPGMGSGMGSGGPTPRFQARCILPGNANQSAALVPFVAKAGLPCTITRARGIGHTARNTLFEVACDDRSGFILSTSLKPDANQPVQTVPCADVPENSNVRCTLSDPKAALLVVDELMAKSDKACTVTDRRVFGGNATGDKFFEVACEQGTGYVVQQTAAGEVGQAVTCAEIGTTAGGCQLPGNKR